MGQFNPTLANLLHPDRGQSQGGDGSHCTHQKLHSIEKSVALSSGGEHRERFCTPDSTFESVRSTSPSVEEVCLLVFVVFGCVLFVFVCFLIWSACWTVT